MSFKIKDVPGVIWAPSWGLGQSPSRQTILIVISMPESRLNSKIWFT